MDWLTALNEEIDEVADGNLPDSTCSLARMLATFILLPSSIYIIFFTYSYSLPLLEFLSISDEREYLSKLSYFYALSVS